MILEILKCIKQKQKEFKMKKNIPREEVIKILKCIGFTNFIKHYFELRDLSEQEFVKEVVYKRTKSGKILYENNISIQNDISEKSKMFQSSKKIFEYLSRRDITLKRVLGVCLAEESESGKHSIKSDDFDYDQKINEIKKYAY